MKHEITDHNPSNEHKICVKNYLYLQVTESPIKLHYTIIFTTFLLESEKQPIMPAKYS